jgi:hypothetical protein
MKTIHEHITQYEKDLDAYYAREKNKLTRIRQVLGAAVPVPRAPLPQGARKTTAKTQVRDRNKTAEVIGLLKRPDGASMAEIASVTGWQDNSIRGFMSGVLRKKMRLRLHSEKVNRERRYKIAA